MTLRRACSIAAIVSDGTAMADDSSTAQKKYGFGVFDTEINHRQTRAYSTIGCTELVCFKIINEQGGIGGRKINLIGFDDGYNQPKKFEQTHKLIKQEEIAVTCSGLGTATNLAVLNYLNNHHVPQLLILRGVAKFGDPKNVLWSTDINPTWYLDGQTHARHGRTKLSHILVTTSVRPRKNGFTNATAGADNPAIVTTA
jgi:branched-chain amino acid transport system substrate-binding protein